MKTASFVLRGLAFVLATSTTLKLHAQSDCTVTARGPNFKVLEKTTVDQVAKLKIETEEQNEFNLE